MKYTKLRKNSIFRKVAMALWGSGGDPSVYGFVDVDVTDLKLNGASPLPKIVKSLAEVMKHNQELNTILRWSGFYHRSRVDISVVVNIPDREHHDLSFAHLEAVDEMSESQVEAEVFKKSDLIRKRQDPRLGFALKLISVLPAFMTRLFLNVYSFLVHDLNLNLQVFKLPRNPFGAMIVTNVGSLGIKTALVPLVPLSRAPVMVAVGAITAEPKVIEGQILIRQILVLGVTFDHRYFDGAHAARMIRAFQEAFKKLSP